IIGLVPGVAVPRAVVVEAQLCATERALNGGSDQTGIHRPRFSLGYADVENAGGSQQGNTQGKSCSHVENSLNKCDRCSARPTDRPGRHLVVQAARSVCSLPKIIFLFAPVAARVRFRRLCNSVARSFASFGSEES